MGMFDKDKEYGNRIDSAFPIGVPFLLLGAELPGRTVSTRFGDAEAAELLVARLRDGYQDGSEFVCTTVATAIVNKVREAEPDDFPAVVELRHEHSSKWRTSALVLQFVAPYQGNGARPAETSA